MNSCGFIACWVFLRRILEQIPANLPMKIWVGENKKNSVGVSGNNSVLPLQDISHHIGNTAKVYLTAAHFRQFIENNKIFR